MLYPPTSWPRGEPTCSSLFTATCCARSRPATDRRMSVRVRCLIWLPQERPVGIRSVDAHVAGGAALIFRVEQIVLRSLDVHARVARARAASVVALQAQGENHRPAQQAPVGGTVRIVAALAAFDHRG